MRAAELQPVFAIVIGGAGSGKNFFIEHDPVLSTYTLVDIDAIKGELGLTAAIGAIKPLLLSAFQRKDNVVHTNMATNLQAQRNKIAAARQHGYTVALYLKDTPPDVAVAQVRKRVGQGGHDVGLDKIVSSNAKARENFTLLRPLADIAKIV